MKRKLMRVQRDISENFRPPWNIASYGTFSPATLCRTQPVGLIFQGRIQFEYAVIQGIVEQLRKHQEQFSMPFTAFDLPGDAEQERHHIQTFELLSREQNSCPAMISLSRPPCSRPNSNCYFRHSDNIGATLR